MGVRRINTSNSFQMAELAELASKLRREHLFVDSEKRELQRLNERVQRAVERLQHVSWVWRHQRGALDALILGRGPSISAATCCRRVTILEGASFVDSYRALGLHDGAYSTLLQGLRQDPRLVALCLAQGPAASLQAVVDVLVTSVYGCGSLPADEALLLHLLQELMPLQLEGCDNVRRMLQHGSCAFSRVYKAFTEGMPGANLFLTSALRAPLIQVLVDDDLFLDIDPSKAVVRFPPEERLRHFGPCDSSEYSQRLGAYRAWTLDRLVRLAQGFLDGLQASWHWFPPALASLVRQLHTTLLRSAGGLEEGGAQAGAVCADLVFAFFVCPAVVSPELAGLVDAHVSHIARFNLMQVAQILQVLAMARWERPDPRLSDLYDRFPRDCISSLLDSLLAGGPADTSPSSQPQLGELVRTGFLATEGQLHTLVTFLRNIPWEGDSAHRKVLESLLATLPSSPKKTQHKSKKAEGEGDENQADGSHCEEVLVIPVPDASFECPGMLPEEKVLSMEQQKRQTKVRMNMESAEVPETVEKRTRFSLSQDQESVGTSDNLEAVSEAASNHSAASSLELENDNFSDMVSANVSGHGTPNISGRDTPSSQVGEEPLERPVVRRNQEQADIEDKFGRFEIAHTTPVQGDETKSIVSDTWSTDVLASDSEMVEQSTQAREAALPQMQVLSSQQLQAPSDGPGDTGSDAWSTDVTTSDTERLQDVDTDDTGSVAARSDDTRSEISAGGDEELPLELHGRSHHHHHHHHHHHRRRSSLKPPPHSPKHLIGASGDASVFPLFVTPTSPGGVSSTSTDAGATSPFRPIAAPEGAMSPLSSNPSPAQPYPPLAPVDLSLLDPLAVQIELRHPERNATQGAEGGEEDVTPTGTHATPSPSGGTVERRSEEDARGMQSLGRLSLAMRELPEEEAFLLLQSGEEDLVKSTAATDERAEDKRSKNFFRNKLSQLRFSFKPKQRKSTERMQNGPDTLPRALSSDFGSALEAADILEKYRGCSSSTPAAQNVASEVKGAEPKPPGGGDQKQTSTVHPGGEEVLLENAQRKLRQVLSLAELPPWGPQEPVALLRGLLAQAMHLQQRALASHIHEALRCLTLLDEQQCNRVVKTLREEHHHRAPYVAYLVRCRQGLLVTLAHLENLLQRTERDRTVCHNHLATLCARHFLDRREHQLQLFLRHFQRLTVADEKAQEVERFLQSLFQEMEFDQAWQAASDLQMNLAQKMIERSIMSQIYVHALYPNGDGDVLRDQVLHQHIQKLARLVTVDHRDLRIPRVYHGEAPWPNAQAELGTLGAYKSPADKVACVASCCAAIMHLLSLAGGVPAADDLMPVLVYVLIQANPPHLLSTVQFVNTFHENRFQGEDAYWWTQFCSAVEFIKTMDY
uniref:Receptor-mediated endocytosis protein 6 homolog n=1 Tax=Ornithodoros turicata TaxID=34597 RepID=A0A2R5LJJ4_9ACAR